MRNKLSLSKRIQKYLKKNGGWVHKGEICKLAQQAGYLAENAGRRCREMESGKNSAGQPIPITLERKEHGGTVWYRYKAGSEPAIRKVEIINGRAYEVVY